MASPPLTHPIVSAGSPGMRKRGCRCSAPWADDSSDDNDDDRRASRHPRLHDTRTRIAPGHASRPCLRIRRLGVRIPSGAPRSEALSVSVTAPLFIMDESFDDLTDLTGGVDTCELKLVIGCGTGHFVLPNISVNPTSNDWPSSPSIAQHLLRSGSGIRGTKLIPVGGGAGCR